MKNRYEIEMTVPLGVRTGTMIMEEQNGNVSGTMEILGYVTTFLGKIVKKRFEITGTLRTKMREIAYRGYGHLDGEEVWLQLESEKSVYEIRGHKKFID